MSEITVVTPITPSRLDPTPSGEVMVTTALRSVAAQTVAPHTHLTRVDYEKAGAVATRNALVASVDTEWFVPLDDDDILQRPFIATLAPHLKGADVVYGRPYVHGSDWTPYRYSFDARDLRKQNYIPATAIIRRSLWEALGGYADVRDEIWDFWLRAVDAGARFRHVTETLWVYRFHEEIPPAPVVDTVPAAAIGRTELHRPPVLSVND